MGLKRFFLSLAFLHLGLVLRGAAYFPLPKLGALGSALDFYARLSGADSSYGFFSPAIGGQTRASFDIVDRQGKTFTKTLEAGNSHEADLRVGNILEEFSAEADNRKFQRSLAASLAGFFIGRYPEATKVTVFLEQYWPVSMAEYRLGRRPQWEASYRATFVHAPRPLAKR